MSVWLISLTNLTKISLLYVCTRTCAHAMVHRGQRANVRAIPLQESWNSASIVSVIIMTGWPGTHHVDQVGL